LLLVNILPVVLILLLLLLGGIEILGVPVLIIVHLLRLVVILIIGTILLLIISVLIVLLVLLILSHRVGADIFWLLGCTFEELLIEAWLSGWLLLLLLLCWLCRLGLLVVGGSDR